MKDSANERLSVIEQRFADFKAALVDRFDNIEKATKLALATVEKSTALAQSTAEKAVARAEAAATRELLEASIRSLRSVFDEQLATQHRATAIALSNAREATDKADKATEKRFENVNEFRATLADQQKTFISKAEVEMRLASIDQRFSELLDWRRIIDGRMAEMAGRGMGASNVIAYIISGVGFVASVIAIMAVFYAKGGSL